MLLRSVFLSLLLALFANALAQDVTINPQSIVVNPKPSFGVEVFVDKDRSGEGTPVYQIGEEIRIGVRTSEAAYIYLYNIRANGEIQQILPNRYDDHGRNHYLHAGETKYFPPRDARYSFTVDGPRGIDKVMAVASTEPLDTHQLADFSSDPNFASSDQGEDSFARTLSIVVRPKAQDSWVTDTARFSVGGRAYRPAYGTLHLDSQPRGADAYVDGQFVGVTPLSYSTRPGEHEIRLELPGYGIYTTRVYLEGGETLAIDGSLGYREHWSPTLTGTQPAINVYFGDDGVKLRLRGKLHFRVKNR